MSKIRSLLTLLILCIAVGIAWLVYASRGSATPIDGPNLSVRSDVLGSQWVVRDENILADSCSAIEGEVVRQLERVLAGRIVVRQLPDLGAYDGRRAGRVVLEEE